MILAMRNQFPFNNRNPEGIDELLEFFEQTLCFRLLVRVDVRAHEQCALHHFVLGPDLEHGAPM